MKKGFTQPFDYSGTTVYLLLQDSVSDRFILFGSSEDIEEYGEEDAYRTLVLDLTGEQSVALELAKFLLSHGLNLNGFRELVRETTIAFSFVDDTPGTEHDKVSLHAQVDITKRESFEQGNAHLLSLTEYANRMRGALFSSRVLNLAICHLICEETCRRSHDHDMSQK